MFTMWPKDVLFFISKIFTMMYILGMGHTSTDMIFEHYQHVMTKQKVQAIENLPKLNLDHEAEETVLHQGPPSETRSPEQKIGARSSSSQKKTTNIMSRFHVHKPCAQAPSNEKQLTKCLANRLK